MTSAPHLHEGSSVRRMMLSAAACLLPAVVWTAVVQGPPVWRVLLVSLGASLLTELAVAGLAFWRFTLDDGSAALTGLLLGCTMPPGVPLHVPAAAAVFAIAVVKMSFGGLGRNWMNPALAGRVFAALSWPSLVGGRPVLLQPASLAGIGSAPLVLLGLGGAYLLGRRIARWEAPAAFAASFGLALWVLGGLPGGDGLLRGELPGPLLEGWFLLCVLFMATDPVTSPVTRLGRLLFGAGCGLLAFLLRVYGARPEGPGLAVILMNMFVPLLNRIHRRPIC